MNKKLSLAVAISFGMLTGAAFAQGTDTGVTMSTDPARAKQVEQAAQAIQSRQSTESTSSSSTMKKPMHHHRAHTGGKASTGAAASAAQ
jgi:hypothetical protein